MGRRLLKRAARGLGLTVLALLLLLAVVVLGINTPWARGQLLERVNAAIADQFQGSLRLTRVGHLGLWGVSGVDAVVLDSAGRIVIDANSVDVRIGLVPLAWDLFAADADTDHIAIESVEVRHARVRLIDSGDGTPTLAQAFSSRSPAPASKKTTTLNIAQIHFGHVWGHGSVSGTAIDTDVTELNGNLGLTGDLFRLAIASADVHSRALPVRVDPRGTLAGTLEVPLKATRGMSASVRFDGHAWGSPSRVRARLDGRSIAANIVLDSVAPEQLRRVLPASKLRAPVALSLNAKGSFDHPELSVQARLGPGRLGAELALNTAARTARATLRIRGLDGSLLDPELPASALSVTASAVARCSDRWSCSADYEVRLFDSEVDGTGLPVSRAKGSFALTDSGAFGAEGKLWVEERGAPTELDYEVQSSGGAPTLRVVGAMELQEPPRLQRWAPGLALRGRLWTDAWVDLGSRRLRLHAKLRLPELRTRELHARLVQIDARAEGDLVRPQLEIAARLETLTIAGRAYREASVQVLGTPERVHVTAHTGAPQELDLDTWVSLTPSLTVSDLALDTGRGDEAVTLRAQSLSFANGRFVGNNVKLETKSGWARVSFDHGPKLRHLRLEARDFDARRAAAPWQLEEFVPHALLSADAKFDQEPAGAAGYLEASVKRFSHGPVKNAAVNLSARLARGHLRGRVDARWRDSAASVTVDELPLASLPPSTPEALSGRVNGSVRLELADLQPLFELGRVPLETAAGEAELTFRVEREPRAPARLEARLETSRLHLVGERQQLDGGSAEAARRAAPWSLTGTDVAARVVLDQATRELSLDASLRDNKGKLAVVKTDVDWPSEAARLGLAAWPALWRRAHVDAHVWLLPRKLSELPAPIAVTDVEGLASVSVHAAGTYQDPSLSFMAQVRDFGPPEKTSGGLDLSASGEYRREGGTARVAAEAGGKRAAEVHAEWRGDPIGYLAHRNALPEIEVRGRLNRFPVSAVPLLTSQRVLGHLNGAFEVKHGDPGWRGEVRLDSNDLTVARISADQLRFRAELSASRFDAAFRASGAALGSLEAEVSGPPPFGPTAVRGPLRAQLQARNFQLKTLDPFVSGSVSGLEGVVNAELTGDLSRDKPDLEGHLELSEGAAQLPALGQALHDIEARLRVSKNRIDLSHLVAHGLTGKFRASGSATLDGLGVSSAQANVAVAERDKLPLTVQGVSMGDAWGNVSLQYRSVDERRRRLDVDVKRFHLELPDVSPPGVQNLDPASDIRVGHETRTGKFVDMPLQPIEREQEGAPQRWIIALDLGDVEIRKGSGIRIGIEGKLKARIGRKTRLNGRIDLTGGTLDVSGKEFKIERGSVTFDRSLPGDGVVTATARWDSPAEYTVYAEYTGTVEQGELRLRSEPPLTQDEVLGLIMFGTPGGTFGAREKNEAATAVGIAGGTVARGLNRALSDISQLDVSTRVDTSTGEARPELVLQVTPRATARVTQAIGEAPPGQSPDRTFLTVDLRLFTRWSLSAQVGDEGGSSLDLIWRHRY